MSKIVQVDSFTSEPFKGNPAGVCILDNQVDEKWMSNVAKEMNLSETAFLLKIKDGYKLRDAIAGAGFEVTPEELDEALMEAHERISGGVCRRCGKGDENTELRYGVCFECMMKEPDIEEI